MILSSVLDNDDGRFWNGDRNAELLYFDGFTLRLFEVMQPRAEKPHVHNGHSSSVGPFFSLLLDDDDDEVLFRFVVGSGRPTKRLVGDMVTASSRRNNGNSLYNAFPLYGSSLRRFFSFEWHNSHDEATLPPPLLLNWKQFRGTLTFCVYIYIYIWATIASSWLVKLNQNSWWASPYR